MSAWSSRRLALSMSISFWAAARSASVKSQTFCIDSAPRMLATSWCTMVLGSALKL